jgi:molybdopterin-guanine dinucleotide biosynthesis protein A
MGRPKPALDWRGTTLLAHVAAVLSSGVDGPVVVVGAPGQPLPPLPEDVESAEDARKGRGPLEGVAAGLRALDGRAELAFVAAADAPFLEPAVVGAVVAALAASPVAGAAVPFVAGKAQPLAAAYRTSLLPLVEELLARGESSVLGLLDRVEVRLLDEEELRRADPSLRSFDNLNTPEEYAAAVRGDGG